MNRQTKSGPAAIVPIGRLRLAASDSLSTSRLPFKGAGAPSALRSIRTIAWRLLHTADDGQGGTLSTGSSLRSLVANQRMLSLYARIPVGLSVIMLTACSTVAVERAKDLSSAGIEYAKVTAHVIDVASTAAVDADSEGQVRSKPRGEVSEEQQRIRAGQLETLDAGLVQTISSYARLKTSVRLIEAYFQALQELANGSQADATGDAVKAVAERINGVNAALEEGKNGAKLNDAQVTALGGLAKVVAAQVHGAKVSKALERDAPIIGRALMLQQGLLKLAGDDIRNNLNEANNRFYVDKIKVPYQRGDIGPTWVAGRLSYLKVRALGQTVEAIGSAEAAAKQMQHVWQRILSGEYSAKEITVMLKDTEDLLDAVQALKDAKASK